MEVSIWHKAGNLIAEVDSPMVPRVGDRMDVDGERLLVEQVKWVVAAEQMVVEVVVGSERPASLNVSSARAPSP